ncbi:hypothetical protein [Streptomyces sp. NBC_01481]|uniref:hypothetical protein n=1 Tax=Streptomyces sp. NBC_01481 TaxID=2975869 RepID=UPI00225322C3|nr:hypothetical protein [Streptomyces sp. NBC_01481]MCX4587047.1 hypothetical protein [Streptomyces sp. NBC_01481]
MADEAPGQIEKPLLWVGVDEQPVLAANQFVGQIDRDGIFLTFGSVTPPFLFAENADQLRTQAEAISYVPVRPLVRLAVSRKYLDELIMTLKQTAENYDRQQGAQA